MEFYDVLTEMFGIKNFYIKIRSFTMHLQGKCTSRFKIYKDLYNRVRDLWLVAGPSVNDFYDNTSSSIRMFADECVLIRTPTDHRYLQNDLDTIILWANKWQMSPNVNKSVVLHCTRSQSPHDYFMDSKHCKN